MAPPIGPAYGVLLDGGARELDAQLGSVDALDAKAAVIFSVASTVAAIVPALLPLGKKGLVLASPAFGFLCAAGVGYISTLVLFYLAYWPGKWRSGPNVERLQQIIAYGEEYARHWAADAYVLSIVRTQGSVKKKRRYLSWTMRAFVLEITMLVGAAISTFAQ